MNVLELREVTKTYGTGAAEVMRLLREACQRGMAVVVVTHDARLASWASRVVRLRDGLAEDAPARQDGAEPALISGEDR